MEGSKPACAMRSAERMSANTAKAKLQPRRIIVTLRYSKLPMLRHKISCQVRTPFLCSGSSLPARPH
eukprot:2119938-Rhodomonas_salina.1